MCGITGWIDYKDILKEKKEVLSRMVDTLVNRGPDAEGTWLSEHAALGHRRLIVVDPHGGIQPMEAHRGDNKYVLVYNGELYNTQELRKELETKNHTFNGHSDTEVVLRAFLEWDECCVERLNGIFAFAVWDHSGQRLFLARDRLGVKPLFYTQRGSAFIFGSELKAILAHPLSEAIVDTEGMAEILVMGPSRTPGHGVFKGIKEVKPGYALSVTPDGIREIRYWSLQSRPHEDDLKTTGETIFNLIKDTVQRQLVSDVPIATFLSGGLDSTVLTAFAAAVFSKNFQDKLHTYEVDYMGNDKFFRKTKFQPGRDSSYADYASQKLKTMHHRVFIETPQLVEALPLATCSRDLPGMADVDTSLYIFCREVKKDVTVVLSGECADEIFGGYPWFTGDDAATITTFPWIRGLKERVKYLSPGITARIRPEEYINERFHEALREVPLLPKEDPAEKKMREIFYLTITRFMPTLLDRKDRMSMAVGLEARVPFCDHRLVEYMWNVPWKIKNYGNMEKGILRLAMEGTVPEKILYRKKSPYPITHNPAFHKTIRENFLHMLDNPAAPVRDILNVPPARDFALSETSASGFPWFGQLMGGPQLLAYYLQINEWMQKYNVKLEM